MCTDTSQAFILFHKHPKIIKQPLQRVSCIWIGTGRGELRSSVTHLSTILGCYPWVELRWSRAQFRIPQGKGLFLSRTLLGFSRNIRGSLGENSDGRNLQRHPPYQFFCYLGHLLDIICLAYASAVRKH